MSSLYDQFKPSIQRSTGNPMSPDLLLASEGDITCYYAPVDQANCHARLVIVGITPGEEQAANALRTAQEQIARGMPKEAVIAEVMRQAAFSGRMRSNLVSMLDKIGINQWLGIPSAAALFGTHSHLLQSTSVLPFPVFRRGLNYNGTPTIARTPLLQRLMREHFVPILAELEEAVVLPLGEVPAEAIEWAQRQGWLGRKRVLPPLLHPSPASNERIQHFLGTRPIGKPLSAKTNGAKIEELRRSLTMSVSSLVSPPA